MGAVVDLLTVYVFFWFSAYCHSVPYNGNGTIFFTYMQERSKFGVRVIYRLDDSSQDILADNGTRACISFLTDLQGKPNTNEHNMLSHWPSVRGELTWSSIGGYYYYQTVRRNLLSGIWIPYKVSIYTNEKFPGCKSSGDAVYEDFGQVYQVPDNVQYCHLDSTSAALNNIPCSQVVNASGESRSEVTTISYKSSTEKLPSSKKRRYYPRVVSTTPKECLGTRCRYYSRKVLLAVGCVPVLIVLVILVSGVVRWIKAKKRGEQANVNRRPGSTAANTLSADCDLSLIMLPGFTAPEGAQASQRQPPQYKDVQMTDLPPAYEELCPLANSTP